MLTGAGTGAITGLLTGADTGATGARVSGFTGAAVKGLTGAAVGFGPSQDEPSPLVTSMEYSKSKHFASHTHPSILTVFIPHVEM